MDKITRQVRIEHWTIKESYYKLIEDGIMWNELPF